MEPKKLMFSLRAGEMWARTSSSMRRPAARTAGQVRERARILYGAADAGRKALSGGVGWAQQLRLGLPAVAA